MKPVSSDALEAWTAEARERWRVPGMVVAILRDGEVVTAASGEREVGRQSPVAVDDVFRIASITKPLVATLVVSLVEDGLLDLDAGTPTLRQLLSHTGGLACERAQPIDGIASGELFSYSNAGFWLVGRAVERAAGTTFGEAMQTRILDPLCLEHTAFEVEGAVPGHHQVTPGGDEHRRADDDYPRERRPSGGLWSTVGDLLRFAGHHLDAAGPLAELQRPAAEGPGFRHGLGWFLRERGGRPTVEHPGSVAGYESLLLLVPDDRLAFAALTNSGRGSAAIRDLLDSLDLALPARDEVALAPEELGKFAGRYEALGVRTLVEHVDARLRLTTSERVPLTDEIVEYPPLVARPVGPREFEVVDGDRRGELFGFPRDGLLSFGILSRRVS